jgi:hypothetical protein
MQWIATPIDPAKPKLYIDLVPQTSWCSNLRTALPKEDWDILRKAAYRYANWKCLICGGRGPNHPLDAHERWNYANGVQKLAGIDGICPACHQVCHFGFARVSGKEKEAFAHLIKINKFSEMQAKNHIDASFVEWEKRSKREWQLDVSFLKEIKAQLSADSEKKIIFNGKIWTFSNCQMA